MVGLLLYNTLYGYDKDGKLLPELADSLPTVSPNARVYTIKLRRGVLFHNGRELKASDVKFSLERQAHPTAQSWGPQFAANIVGGQAVIDGKATTMQGIEAVDDYTVRITLLQPQNAFTAILTMAFNAVVPRSEVERWGNDYRLHPVGTGPFTLERWTPGQEVVFVRHAKYFRANRPALERVVYKLGVDQSVALLRFEKGEADYLADSVAAQDVSRVRGDAALSQRIFIAENPFLTFLIINNQTPPFNDARVRRAMSMLIDRNRLIQVAGGIGVPAQGYIVPRIACYDANYNGVPQFDPTRARQLLAEAGYPNGFTFNLDTTVTGSIPFAADWLQVMQQSLAQAGVRAELRRFTSAILSRQLVEGSSVVALTGWGASILDPVDHIGTLVESNGVNARRARYSNGDIDRLFKQAERTASPAVRCRYYQQINRIALDDLPIIPLHVLRTVHLRSPRLAQFAWHPIYNAPIFEELALGR
jgi:peptide/nickel transport system substrate-binding protein